MTDPTTSVFIVAVAAVVVFFDIWIVWRRGGNSTVSWVLDVWYTLHPAPLCTVFVLMGHIFFPVCAPNATADSQSISPTLGTAIGIVGVLGIVGFLIWERRQPAPPPTGPVVTRAYLHRLMALAGISMAIGHFLFKQYITCSG